MDKKDEKILEILQEDGRASYTEIAEEIDVSEGTVRNRVEQMKNEGVIEKFTVEVNESKEIESFVSIKVSTDREFGDILAEIPEDIQVYELAGDIDILAKITAETSEQINEKVDEIRKIEGVENTSTYMVLSS